MTAFCCFNKAGRLSGLLSNAATDKARGFVEECADGQLALDRMILKWRNGSMCMKKEGQSHERIYIRGRPERSEWVYCSVRGKAAEPYARTTTRDCNVVEAPERNPPQDLISHQRAPNHFAQRSTVDRALYEDVRCKSVLEGKNERFRAAPSFWRLKLGLNISFDATWPRRFDASGGKTGAHRPEKQTVS